MHIYNTNSKVSEIGLEKGLGLEMGAQGKEGVEVSGTSLKSLSPLKIFSN